MEKRQLGGSGLSIAPIIFGGNVFGWTVDEPTSHMLLDAFLDEGGDAIDTADLYAGHESERIIGRWMKQGGRRDKVVITSKVGLDADRQGIRADTIVAACDDSLARLQTDYIDIYELHRDYAEVPPEEFMGALARLVQAGKIRVAGASNFNTGRLADSLGVSDARQWPRFHVLQPEYNLMYRAMEKEVVPFCLEHDIAITPYFSLASGYLTGKYRNAADKGKSPRGSRMDRYMTEGGPSVLAAMEGVATRHDATLAEVALAWLMAKPGVAAPIASATSRRQLDGLIRATRLKLTEEDMASLDDASSFALDSAPFYG